ncbi:hypothetical protein IKE98_01115 [Candidatus Saccharibacteria bacterium]|nr:hypothetical protein [Candidatus Saccharibacteria bacterium]
MRTDFEPELGRAQRIQVLLNSKNEMPIASSVEEAKENLWQDIEIGKVFYENEEIQGIFSNLPEKTIEALSKDWKLVPFSSLTPEECPDYDIILAGIEKAGYIPS